MSGTLNSTVDQWGRTGQGRTVIISFCLGAAVGIGYALAKLSVNFVDLGLYLIAVSVFHLWEYLYVCIYHPSDISTDSFMVNHSKAALIAQVACWVEYSVEWCFFPSMKSNWPIYSIGFILVVGGQLLRTIAMSTAGQNFSHQIVYEKKPEHTLVTYGVYSVVRHPSYTGWFVWSIATQIMLFNPVCILAYAYVSWTFFNTRILYEEQTLTNHFGAAYKQYQKDVPSGIPYVK